MNNYNNQKSYAESSENFELLPEKEPAGMIICGSFLPYFMWFVD